MTDNLVRVVFDRAVRQHFAQNGVIPVNNVVVVVHAADDFARFVIRAQRHAADDAAVQIKHSAVANDAADNLAARIAHQTVREHDAQNRVALLRVHVVIHVIRQCFQLTENLAVRVVDQTVGIRRADSLAVVGNHLAVFVRFTDEIPERIVRFRTDGGFQRQNAFALRILADRFARSVQNFARRRHIADDVAVRVHNRFADGDNFADFKAFLIKNAVGHIRIPDHVAVQINDRAVGKRRADDFAVFADNLPHPHKHATDRRTAFVNDAAVGQLQISQIFRFVV